MDIKHSKIHAILQQPPLTISGRHFLFLGGMKHVSQTAGSSGFQATLQDFFKRNPILYKFIIDVISPVVTTKRFHNSLQRTLRRYDPNHVIVNYGSGPFVLEERHDIINVDLFAFESVDVVCESHLPFLPDSVDLFVSIAVMEHLRDPLIAVAEMYRCLKPGGEVLVYVPFMQPLHAAPHDYQRYTQAGLREIFHDFELLELGVGSGSTSGFLWVFQHWLANLLSCGNKMAKEVLLVGLMIALFPIKYLDLLLEPIDRSGEIASAHFIRCRKC